MSVLKSARSLPRIPAKAALVVARLLYAFLTGAALVLALQDAGNAEQIGVYTYQAGLGSAAAIVLALGIDKMLARRVSAGEIQPRYPRSMLALRATETVLICLVSVGLAFVVIDDFLVYATAAFVVSRLWYADAEALWIASDAGDGILALSLVLNGLITGLSIFLGVQSGAPAMAAGSALGNVVGAAVLVGTGRVRIADQGLPGGLVEARGFGLSAVLATTYARVDLLILAALDVSLQTVAVYGLVTRVYDALALVRGAIAQQETRELASLGADRRIVRLVALARRTAVASAIFSTLALTFIVAINVLSPRTLGGAEFAVLLAAGAVAPLFFSHLPTAALVFADRRSNLLLKGSLGACAASVVLKATMIGALGVPGAALSLGLVEYCSCFIFLRLYFEGRNLNWRPVAIAPLIAFSAPAAIAIALVVESA